MWLLGWKSWFWCSSWSELSYFPLLVVYDKKVGSENMVVFRWSYIDGRMSIFIVLLVRFL